MAQQTTVAPPRYAALGVRMVLTLIGAAGLIVGAFLVWVDSIKGNDLSIRSIWNTSFAGTTNFVTTVGFAVIVLGVLAIVGLAFSTGWLTRIAGVLGIVAFTLFVIQVYRMPGNQEVGPGAWVSLAGGVVALIAGFFGARTTVPAATTTTVVQE